MSTNPDVPAFVSFERETAELFVKALSFYESSLKRDLESIKQDPLLNELLSGAPDEDSPIQDEVDNSSAIREDLEKHLANSKGKFHIVLQVNQWWARFVKSVSMLYLEHLRSRRNIMSASTNVSRAALDAVDKQLSRLNEKFNTGIFSSVLPRPLLLDQVAIAEDIKVSITAPEAISRMREPAPVILESIGILDPEIRNRCLDVYKSFRETKQHDRQDMVLSEATRILEDRIRRVTGAPEGTAGNKLVDFAFGGKTPLIQLSSVAAEQEAPHLLFRGVFGFIRNQVHHRLVGELIPDRVLQIIGMIDYMISLLDARPVSNSQG